MIEIGMQYKQEVWNPVTGCDKVSAGCDNCYALRASRRLKAFGVASYQTDGNPVTSGPGFGVALHPGTLDRPRHWRKPRMVFVTSMSDLFHARVPVSFVRDVFDVMAETPQHLYQVLTKRPSRARRLADQLSWPDNVWVGTSVESQDVMHRIGDLRALPAALRFVFLEPLIGPVSGLDLDGIGWVSVGGEAAGRPRPLDADWARAIRDQCQDEGVPFFFKQWGGRSSKAGGRELDGRTWDELPFGLRATTSDGMIPRTLERVA
jgi:protein gp37